MAKVELEVKDVKTKKKFEEKSSRTRDHCTSLENGEIALEDAIAAFKRAWSLSKPKRAGQG